MIRPGDLVVFRFPQTDLEQGKLRPALLLRQIPNDYGDWLVCMVSSQLHHQIKDLELIISRADLGFERTGLKGDSLIRSSRLAVVGEDIFEGKLGLLQPEMLQVVRERLSTWIASNDL